MAGGDANLSPERMARVFGLTGPGYPRLPDRSPVLAEPPGESESAAGGWVPEQPGPHRPGKLGRLLGEGRHRDVCGVRERLGAPAGLRGALLHPSSRAVAGLGVIVVLALAVILFRVWRADAAAVPVQVASRSAPTPSALVSRSVEGGTDPLRPGGNAVPPSDTSGTSGSNQGRLSVHVVGAVRRPGVIEVANGSRLGEAIQRCGGAVRGADLGAVNLARVLSDGEQVVVPVLGRPPGPGSPQPAPGAVASPSAGGLVNLNTADAAGLDELPGVGPKIAERIITWRTEHGRFTSIDELSEVSGIGDKMLSRLRSLVCI